MTLICRDFAVEEIEQNGSGAGARGDGPRLFRFGFVGSDGRRHEGVTRARRAANVRHFPRSAWAALHTPERSLYQTGRAGLRASDGALAAEYEAYSHSVHAARATVWLTPLEIEALKSAQAARGAFLTGAAGRPTVSSSRAALVGAAPASTRRLDARSTPPSSGPRI